MKSYIVLVFLAMFVTQVANAMSFNEIWSSVQRQSLNLKASEHESIAAKIGADRAGRHWFPRIYANGRVFGTNDSATTFMMQLGQRQISAADFSPNLLNRPGMNTFQQGALGVDLSLYEGGSRIAQAQAADKMAQAKDWESKSRWVEEYSIVARNYAFLLALNEEKQALGQLSTQVSLLIERYRIGSKSNLVGYSGLLGLKNLKNRIQGILAMNHASDRSAREEIQARTAELPDDWQPDPISEQAFLKKTFPDSSQVSAAVMAEEFLAQSLERSKEAEKSRFLPRVGLFAQGDLYRGNRATGTSITSGAYLQWDLFSASNFGAIDQAAHVAAAAAARSEMASRKSQADLHASRVRAESSEKALSLLNQSAELLSEQTRTAQSLFQSGAINALQLVEVLNRRLDLLANRRETQFALIASQATVFQSSAQGEVIK